MKYDVVATPRSPAHSTNATISTKPMTMLHVPDARVAGDELDDQAEPGDLQLQVGQHEDHAEHGGERAERREP